MQFTGGLREKRTWRFRGEQYEYMHTAWLCEDSGELFTTDETDDAGYVQVTNQYRVKYGIPFTDEIIAIREKYDISAAKADRSKLSDFEIKILDTVCARFATISSAEISRISHEEEAWLQCKPTQDTIPMEYAFSLKAI